MTRAAVDLGLFMIMFMLVMCAMTAAFWMAFGGSLTNYQTFSVAMMTLLRMAIGDFDYAELEETHRVLGPVLFLMYLVIVFFFLLNMFLAIIADAHAQVMEEEGKKQFDFSKLRRRMTNLTSMVGYSKQEIQDFADDMDLADADGDGMVDAGELEAILAKHGGMANILQSPDSKALMAKYDLNGDGQLDKDEMKLLMADLQAKMQEAGAEEVGDNPVAKDREAMANIMAGGDEGVGESAALKAAQSSSALAGRVNEMEERMVMVSSNQEGMLGLMDEVMGKVSCCCQKGSCRSPTRIHALVFWSHSPAQQSSFAHLLVVIVTVLQLNGSVR
jgi:Ca2+-binding EF-hand superfamily protein